MPKTSYWPDEYLEKRKSVEEAIDRIRSGQRVFIGSYCGEPQHLVRGLAEKSNRFTDLEIIRLMSKETSPLTQIAEKTEEQSFKIRSIYLGSAKTEDMAKNLRFHTPVNVSEVPHLFKTRRIPLDVALIQVSPPDDFGWMSLGVSVDITLSAAMSADLVIAQINERMPRVLGRCFINVNDVDIVVEHDEELLTIPDLPGSDRAKRIGSHIARLIEDGSTIQIGLDATSQATSQILSGKNDLGVHSFFLTEDIMHLYAMGVINNRKKGFNEGKLVAACAIGSSALYDFLDSNPAVDFHPFDYVNDIDIISRHNRMISMNVAQIIDLAGQVSCDAMSQTLYAGVSGIPNFVRGANRSKNGKSIIMLPSTAEGGKKSRIVPLLTETIITVPRDDVRFVVTEYGAVSLFGKTVQERALALISIAHPDFRDELLEKAKKLGMVGHERSLGESVRGVYPVKLEENIEIDGETITFRPAKPVDERRIQEHYYHLDRVDVISRFFHEKNRFPRGDLEGLFKIDYIRNLTILAIVGEFGFGKVLGVGEYYLDESTNMAEVAFSVSKRYQGKGMGHILIRKLAEAAQEHGVNGLFAYTSQGNQRMIRLFKTLPFKTRVKMRADIHLSCRFDEPEPKSK